VPSSTAWTTTQHLRRGVCQSPWVTHVKTSDVNMCVVSLCLLSDSSVGQNSQLQRVSPVILYDVFIVVLVELKLTC
jgi:hypothetical protein